MGLQGLEGCDIPCEHGWQLQATDADCAEEDGGPACQCTGMRRIAQVVKIEHLPCLVLWLLQARYHPGLEDLDFCRHLHKTYSPLGKEQGAGEHPREQGSGGGWGRQGNRVLKVALYSGQSNIALAMVLS